MLLYNVARSGPVARIVRWTCNNVTRTRLPYFLQTSEMYSVCSVFKMHNKFQTFQKLSLIAAG